MTRWREVVSVVRGQETSDGAGVRLKRSLGSQSLDYLDPFLLLDEFKSEERSDYIGGFPDHPHRGFETVTYMLAGSMEHRDHKGHHGNLVSGSVQWMTAGRGIIHSEMPRQTDGLMWGFQLWINLPAELKMSNPRYQDIPPEQIPTVEGEEGMRVKVIAGEFRGAKGPVSGIATDPLYLDVSIRPGSRFEQPMRSGHSAFAYVFEGEGNLGLKGSGGGKAVSAGYLAVLSDGDRFAVQGGKEPVRFLLLSARPLGEPMVRYGPFVMTTEDELREAFQDYRNGTFLG